MTVESHEQDAIPKLTARQELERHLAEERAGSARINAIADAVALERARNSLSAMAQGFGEGSSQVIVAAAELAAVEETIRRQKMSPRAYAYTPAFQEEDESNLTLGNGLLGYYFREHMQTATTPNANDISLAACDALLADLSELNLDKSQQTLGGESESVLT